MPYYGWKQVKSSDKGLALVNEKMFDFVECKSNLSLFAFILVLFGCALRES
jgi:hypothetical protein